jgi:TetR/AcrR family transcriptional regulator
MDGSQAVTNQARQGSQGAPVVSNGADTRRQLIQAASDCIVRRGNAKVRMAEVAKEAGVSRSTVYRHFSTQADLVIGVLLSRVDAALTAVVERLPDPGDAVRSIPDLMLGPVALVAGNPLNEALFSSTSEGYVAALELSSEPLVDAMTRHLEPLLEQWQATGQLFDDLDIRETVRWMNAVALILLAAPWRTRSEPERRAFVERYVVRALVTNPA